MLALKKSADCAHVSGPRFGAKPLHTGATADRVMAHLESCHTNTVNAPAVYVAISSAKDAVALYADSRARLTEVLGLRDGVHDEARRDVEVAVGWE